jgi:hypothetical protein
VNEAGQRKSKILMRGHRRIIARVGEKKYITDPATGGYDVSCVCGWQGGNHSRTKNALKAYSDHLGDVVSAPRVCRGCKVEKAADQFVASWSRYLCRTCYSKMGNDWALKNPDKSAAHKRNFHLEKKFGITQFDVDNLIKKQSGVCAVCKLSIVDVRGFQPHIDHCHKTGLVRGVL